MAKRAYTRRYSQAVFQIALERNELDRWQSELRKIATLSEDKTFTALLENPKVYFSDKQRLLSERFSDVNPLVLNLIYLLLARDSLGLTDRIADEFQQLLDNYRGIERAEVLTAVPLDDEDKTQLEKHLSTLTGKNVVVEPEVDPSLVGGLIARVGGKLIDGSTRSRLETLKRQLVEGK